MALNMKYIIFEDTKTGLIQPVIFGDHTTHAQIKIERAKPISEGFFSFENGKMQVYGKSYSLGIDSKDTDLDYITKLFLNLGTAYFVPGIF